MKFKRGKYNLIFVLMMMLIIGVFGYEIYQSTLPVQNTQPADPGSADVDPGPDVGPGDQDTDPSDDQDQNQDDQLDSYAAEKIERYPDKVLKYCLDKLFVQSAGYKSTFERTMTNDAGVMKVVQEIDGSIEKCGDKSFENLTFTSENTTYGVNNIRAFYFEGENVTAYETQKGNTTDFSKANKTEMTKQQYLQKYSLNLAEMPNLTFISGTYDPKSYKTKDGREYFGLTVGVKLSDAQIKFYQSSGDLKDAQANGNSTYTFYIWADTSTIFQIKSTERLAGKHSFTGMDVTINTVTTQKFTAMSEEFEITKP